MIHIPRPPRIYPWVSDASLLRDSGAVQRLRKKKKITSSRQLESVWIRRRSQWVALTQFHGETKVPKHSLTLVKRPTRPNPLLRGPGVTLSAFQIVPFSPNVLNTSISILFLLFYWLDWLRTTSLIGHRKIRKWQWPKQANTPVYCRVKKVCLWIS